MTSAALRTTRADHARGIPMAMLIGLQPPIAPDGKAIDPDPPPAGRAHTKVCNSTLYRAHDLLTRLGPCEAKAIATETGWSKSHTSYTLRAMAELGMATSRPLPNNRLLWTVVDGSEVRVDCNASFSRGRQGRRLEAIVRRRRLMPAKQIRWFGRDVILACDGRCTKAWGLNCRPKVEFDNDEPDDVAWLADDELGEAPADPGTYEGGYAKPAGPYDMNKWCARECERSNIFEAGEEVKVRDLSQRMYNQPWKHVPSNAE